MSSQGQASWRLRYQSSLPAQFSTVGRTKIQIDLAGAAAAAWSARLALGCAANHTDTVKVLGHQLPSVADEVAEFSFESR